MSALASSLLLVVMPIFITVLIDKPSLLDNTNKFLSKGREFKKFIARFFNLESKEDEFFYLLILTAYFIQIDESCKLNKLDKYKRRDKELKYISNYFKKHLNLSSDIVDLFTSILYQQIQLIKDEVFNEHGKSTQPELINRLALMTSKAKAILDYGTKLQMLSFLYGLCCADGDYDLTEKNGLKEWAKTIGISEGCYAYIVNNHKVTHDLLLEKYSKVDHNKVIIENYLFLKKIYPNDNERSNFINKLIKERKESEGSKEKELEQIQDLEKTRKDKEAKENLEKARQLREKTAARRKLKKKQRIDLLKNTGIWDEITLEQRKEFLKMSEVAINTFIKKFEEQVFVSTEFIKLPVLKQHLNELDEELKAFTDIISKKLKPSDNKFKLYQRYVENAYFMAIENINNLYEKIGKKKFAPILKEMPDDLDAFLVRKKAKSGKEKQEIVAQFEEAIEDIKSVIATNKEAMDNIEEITVEVATLDSEDLDNSKVIEDAIKELDEWTDKVKLYNS